MRWPSQREERTKKAEEIQEAKEAEGKRAGQPRHWRGQRPALRRFHFSNFEFRQEGGLSVLLSHRSGLHYVRTVVGREKL